MPKLSKLLHNIQLNNSFQIELLKWYNKRLGDESVYLVNHVELKRATKGGVTKGKFDHYILI